MSKSSSVPSPVPVESRGASAHAKSSYGQIFKSTALTGGASAVNILLGVIRTKVIAVLLGPSGVGLMGVYTTITGFASAVAGMGVGSSGVRQIAEAAGTEDQDRIARTAATLRRTVIVLGLSGAVLLAVFSVPLSTLTFGHADHSVPIALLGVTVFFTTMSSGQTALLRGLRRIADLARINVLGSLTGTIVGLPLIWFLRDRGIVPVLIVIPASALLFSWWFARRVNVPSVKLSLRATWSESQGLLRLGMAFMFTALITAAAAYATRILVVRELGLDAAGHYTAAFTLAGIYAGFILDAMGSDFYPRLTGAANEHTTANRLVNEQTEIALLMAVPGIIATITFAPWVIWLFYAESFGSAVEVLQWQVLGMLGRVITWPMGFIILAKGMGGLRILSETLANIVHVALVWVLLPHFGVAGAGIAFAGLYLFYGVIILFISRKLTGFRWSRVNLGLIAWTVPTVCFTLLLLRTLPLTWGMAVGLVTALVSSYFCLKGILRRVPQDRLGRFVTLARWLG